MLFGFFNFRNALFKFDFVKNVWDTRNKYFIWFRDLNFLFYRFLLFGFFNFRLSNNSYFFLKAVELGIFHVLWNTIYERNFHFLNNFLVVIFYDLNCYILFKIAQFILIFIDLNKVNDFNALTLIIVSHLNNFLNFNGGRLRWSNIIITCRLRNT